MAELVIVRGASGSGKTTYVKKNFPDYNHYEADMYHYDKDGNYNWKVENLAASHKWCQDFVRLSLKSGKNTVVSNTSTTLKEVNEYVKIAEDVGVPYRVIRLETQFKNVHGVPDDKVEMMRKKLADNLFEGEEVVK